MRLPSELQAALTRYGAAPGVVKAAAVLSERYRNREFATAALRTEEERIAYLLVRMPATFAACRRALELVQAASPGLRPSSMLDLGAGPGTASWAGVETFPSLERVSMVERDSGMVNLGRVLMSGSEQKVLGNAAWETGDFARWQPREADLIVISYAVGELAPAATERLVCEAWKVTRQALVVVEPGTRAGFATVEKIRSAMISAGATIAAPCPHELACPMAAAGDWCHFSQRVERSSAHRRIKGGELGHEDEKFSFVAFTKVGVNRPDGRVVRHPIYRPKLVQMTLCTSEGLKDVTVTKSQGERYRMAKKAEWGSALDPTHDFSSSKR